MGEQEKEKEKEKKKKEKENEKKNVKEKVEEVAARRKWLHHPRPRLAGRAGQLVGARGRGVKAPGPPAREEGPDHHCPAGAGSRHYSVCSWYNITLCTAVYSCVQLCTVVYSCVQLCTVVYSWCNVVDKPPH
jgi:hypothetical protein